MKTAYICCDKPSIAKHDFKEDGAIIENKCCLRCSAHWYRGKQYTGREWDAWLELPSLTTIPATVK